MDLEGEADAAALTRDHAIAAEHGGRRMGIRAYLQALRDLPVHHSLLLSGLGLRELPPEMDMGRQRWKLETLGAIVRDELTQGEAPWPLLKEWEEDGEAAIIPKDGRRVIPKSGIYPKSMLESVSSKAYLSLLSLVKSVSEALPLVRFLDLSYNRLTELPRAISMMKDLRALDLEGNLIAEINCEVS